jgi:hypothetical protein
MSYNEPINEYIYNIMGYENLRFWAERPKEVFEFNDSNI